VTILDILRQPTTLDVKDRGKYHESLARSFHITEKAAEWARAGVPGEVLAEWIDFLQGFEPADLKPHTLKVHEAGEEVPL
jgi:hypothetical protein